MTAMHSHFACMERSGYLVPANLILNTRHAPASLVLAGAGSNWPPSGYHCLVSGKSHRPNHVKALAAPESSARSLHRFSVKNINQNTKLRVDKFFELEMTVRDSELDKYGVVNNAIYVVYIHEAREELVTRLGISTAYLARTGNAMALSELNLKYFTPLRSGDKFVVRVRVLEIKGARLYVEHFIDRLPDRKLVLEAGATVVCLNKDYRPTRVFPEMSSKLLQFFTTDNVEN